MQSTQLVTRSDVGRWHVICRQIIISICHLFPAGLLRVVKGQLT